MIGRLLCVFDKVAWIATNVAVVRLGMEGNAHYENARRNSRSGGFTCS
jgi:hypothetical protein